jgi:hypothetical protein
MIKKPNYLIDTVNHINTLLNKNVCPKWVDSHTKQLPPPWSKDEEFSFLFDMRTVRYFIENSIYIAQVIRHHDRVIEEHKRNFYHGE